MRLGRRVEAMPQKSFERIGTAHFADQLSVDVYGLGF